MVKHVIVDGSNLATEGRTQPSLAQLNEAVLAFIEEFPDVKVTVVVDATFGHRINKREVNEYNEAVDNNELVAPPAGAVGRGDAFVLSIADKVKASILSNDSYQEFHGKYPWLFDEGRLIGGKPVPHIGWVFVERLPVRGATSRRAMKAGGKVVAKEPPKASSEASRPMPVPKAPPPGAKRKAIDNASLTNEATVKTADKRAADKQRTDKQRTDKRGAAAKNSKSKASVTKTRAPKSDQIQARPTNTADVMAYLTFVEKHPVGAVVKGVVDGFAANGVIVKVGEIRGYAPLRLLGNPAPRRPRDVFAMGESVTLMIAGYTAARRSVDLGISDVVSTMLAKKQPDKKIAIKKNVAEKKLAKKVAGKKLVAGDRPVRKTVNKKATTKKITTKKITAKKTATDVTAKKSAKKITAKKTSTSSATTKPTAARTKGKSAKK